MLDIMTQATLYTLCWSIAAVLLMLSTLVYFFGLYFRTHALVRFRRIACLLLLLAVCDFGLILYMHLSIAHARWHAVRAPAIGDGDQ